LTNPNKGDSTLGAQKGAEGSGTSEPLYSFADNSKMITLTQDFFPNPCLFQNYFLSLQAKSEL
jgi:hypothetical protein